VVTVLVVEDELLLKMNVSEELSEAGYDVLNASNADEAIKILEKRNDIHTIFTDINMPGSMDGLKLASAVRHRWPPVNIIITTGRNRPSTEQVPKGSIFLPKPYLPSQVIKAVEAFV
jgi:CheY-like chemotaxis protein